MREGSVTKEQEGILGMMKLFYIFVMVTVELYVLFKTHRTIHKGAEFYCV